MKTQNENNFKSIKRNGFALIEVILLMSIFAIITIGILSYYQYNHNSYKVQSELDQIINITNQTYTDSVSIQNNDISSKNGNTDISGLNQSDCNFLEKSLSTSGFVTGNCSNTLNHLNYKLNLYLLLSMSSLNVSSLADNNNNLAPAINNADMNGSLSLNPELLINGNILGNMSFNSGSSYNISNTLGGSDLNTSINGDNSIGIHSLNPFNPYVGDLVILPTIVDLERHAISGKQHPHGRTGNVSLCMDFNRNLTNNVQLVFNACNIDVDALVYMNVPDTYNIHVPSDTNITVNVIASNGYRYGRTHKNRINGLLNFTSLSDASLNNIGQKSELSLNSVLKRDIGDGGQSFSAFVTIQIKSNNSVIYQINANLTVCVESLVVHNNDIYIWW